MKIIRRIVRSPWFWLIFISLLPLSPLLHAGIPLTHDGRIHIARIANFYASLTEGNIVPRWASNLNWGYGNPILEFVYPLPSYIASLFHALGLSLVDSTKLVFGISYVASVLAMYIWVREHWGEKAGVIAAILYGYAPYRFVDLYVRGALGEHMAFIFPPLACYFIMKLRTAIRKRKTTQLSIGILGLTLSFIGLILSHNALSLIFLPVVLLYGVYMAITEKEHRGPFLFYLSVASLFGLLLTSFFWIPAILEAKYTLQDKITQNVISGNFVPLSWLFYSPWNYGGSLGFTKSVGLLHWVGVISMICIMPKMKKTDRNLLLIFLLLLVISLFMMLQESNFIWSQIPILQKFQFPWRLLSLSVFLASILGGIAFSRLSKSLISTVFILACIILLTSGMWKPKGYLVEPEATYTGVFDSTTDSGELSPAWSVRFMEYRPKQRIEVVGGNALVHEGRRNTTTREYLVESQSITQLVENTLYFPGWDVYVDDTVIPIEFQDPNHRGLITFLVPQGKHSVKILFTDTKVRRMANAITLVSVIILGLSALGGILWRKRT